jgi:hypothetical protein
MPPHDLRERGRRVVGGVGGGGGGDGDGDGVLTKKFPVGLFPHLNCESAGGTRAGQQILRG